MTLYKGSQQIRDTGAYGVYKGSQPIDAIYKGSQLVYLHEYYEPQTTLVEISNGNTQTITLPDGVYQIYIAGGGGNVANWGAGGYLWSAGGGSGGAVEGMFYNPETASFTFTAGAANQNSTATRAGATIITCNKGGNGGQGGGGAGGTASFTGITNVSLVARNGNTGGNVQLGTDRAGGDSVSSKKWGSGTVIRDGGVHYGGVIVQYVRRLR